MIDYSEGEIAQQFCPAPPRRFPKISRKNLVPQNRPNQAASGRSETEARGRNCAPLTSLSFESTRMGPHGVGTRRRGLFHEEATVSQHGCFIGRLCCGLGPGHGRQIRRPIRRSGPRRRADGSWLVRSGSGARARRSIATRSSRATRRAGAEQARSVFAARPARADDGPSEAGPAGPE
jgi:hypothetical protein